MSDKSVLSQRLDSALLADIKKYADANTGGNLRIATEDLLRLGFDSLNKKTDAPMCPSCGEPLKAPYWICKKEGKVMH
jgi:hypothetical protein